MNTILILNILGVYWIASGLFLIFRRKTLPLLLKDFFDHPATMWLAGLVLIIVGGLIVFQEQEYLLATVLGWLILIKGAVYIVKPSLFSNISPKFLRSLSPVWGIVSIALGIWLLTL